MRRTTKQNFRCSFCGKDKSEALILIAGIEGHICEACVEQAGEIIEEELYGKKRSDNRGGRHHYVLPDDITPREIKEHLDQ